MQTIPAQSPESLVTLSALAECIGQTVQLHGFVHKIRQMRGFAFVLLRTHRDVIQCTLDGPCDLLEGMCVQLTADVVADSRAKAGYELRIRKADVLSTPPEVCPIAIHGKELDLSLETLLDERAITLRHAAQRAIFKIQEGLALGMRAYLIAQAFTEIHSPKLITGGVEGGANQFTLPYFGKTATLAQSPQAYKQMLVPVFERVFEIGPVFRAEKHDTSRHLSEYTSFDIEMGFITSLSSLLTLETALLQSAFAFLKEHYAPEIALLGVNVPDADAIPVLRFDEAKALLRSAGQENPDAHDFDPEEEKQLCALIEKETGSAFVYVTHYPSAKRPFYAMDDPADERYTLSYDLLFRGLEITTGGLRIHDYAAQVAKLTRRGMHVESFDDYLAMHRAGMPPHGGMGIGLERLCARLLELPNIRQTTLFPRDTRRLRP